MPKKNLDEFSLDQSLGFLLRQSHRALTKQLETRIAPYNLNIGSWFFLRVLWDEDDISQSELSKRAGVMEPTTVIALDRMEKQGWIVRSKDKADGRRSVVSLTDSGRALKTQLLPIAAETISDFTETLTETEFQQLKYLLSKVLAEN